MGRHGKHNHKVMQHALHFRADLAPLYVVEVADSLPTCVCYHVESLGKYFWSLDYFFDTMIQALESGDNASPTNQPELNKFTKSVQSRLDQADAKELLGDNSLHMKPSNPRYLRIQKHCVFKNVSLI